MIHKIKVALFVCLQNLILIADSTLAHFLPTCCLALAWIGDTQDPVSVGLEARIFNV